MNTKAIKSNNLLLIIINLSVIFVVVVLAKSDHDHDHDHHHHHHHHSDHQHGHQLLNKAKKIYNGRRASRDEAKFMAAILEPKGGGLTAQERIRCSAVIITHDTLLTAGHCFDNLSHPRIRRMEILPGASRIDSGYYRTHGDLIRNIQAFWIHPEYHSKLNTYDLAVVKVGPAPWRFANDRRRRLTVAQMPVRIERWRRPLEAYGYGLEDQGVLSGYLNVIEYTRIYAQPYCELMVGRRFNTSDILFATKERSDHQHLHISSGQSDGDSGGGIFLQGTVERLDTAGANRWISVTTKILVGIHSHSRVRQETMRPRTYFFHTNITTFLPWIQRYSDARFDTYPFPQPLH